MILVIENRRALDAIPPTDPPQPAATGSLQRTLRRMGFHAARPAPRRPATPSPPSPRAPVR